MFRLAYRNFGDHESMVVAHTVKPGTGSTATAATRWYELRSTPPGGTFLDYQSGTLQDATASLWMASAAMDKRGDIAIGMSASSGTVDPSVMYTGRVPTDPPGIMGALSTVLHLIARDRCAAAYRPLGRLQQYEHRSGRRLHVLVHARVLRE